MGVDPDLDDDVEILNGGFDDGSAWGTDGDWIIGGGVAHALTTGGGGGSLFQNAGFNEGFRYRVTFTILNFNVTDPPNDGLKLQVGGVLSPLFNANGTFTFEAVAINDLGFISLNQISMQIGDSFDVDNVTLLKLMNYADDILDIVVIEPRFSTVEVAVASDYWNRLNARPDNTNVLIAFDLP